MNFNLIVLSLLTLIVIGCGKNRSSKTQNVVNGAAGVCSQQTIALHNDLVYWSQRPLNRTSRINDIYNSCELLESTLGNQSCSIQNYQDGTMDFLSYSQVASYCAEVETYVNQRNPPPPPVPVDRVPSPTQRPPRYSDVLIENLDGRYGIYFLKSHIESHEMDIRNGDTRCQVSISYGSNGYLRNVRARFVSVSISTTNNRSIYEITMSLPNSNDLARVTCRSLNKRMTVDTFNRVMQGVAEIRIRN